MRGEPGEDDVEDDALEHLALRRPREDAVLEERLVKRNVPLKALEFGAAEMRLNYSEKGVISKIEGEKEAELKAVLTPEQFATNMNAVIGQ